ncbi:beta-lactamase [Alkalihalobacillus alcalophilus ATCC 27647 = CGMCC 1.3604]|uniref:Beta-lactamase n=1 Tax=Alkalihalobacillus alcalophilus ATCC 27647 = CGMCC 1.3604 TaxID=1218173 RepID=A0A094WLK5_ALKAL|nr:MBL fold metallo-hydrolase [Alkalihalobacillus alcalophilus]KGA98639.1 beta-lactamase [Alkalihalobacillus alcalophilus ATCC 27647 = CGMCC 1.3604]MED1562757.1 MBL fold metallo-hydrolase [Alkalihalobacillus alcalophilus]THG89649.1 beta-lactamase [Alkalihalobacillus alcalophilus ATCC 27647 = CGMCC 1.3604]
MKISILGGGSEVGASCLHIEVADTNILIDAGMRMHGDEPLPALGMLEGLAAPEVILVTHAHADHIGALPIVHSFYPNTPIYTTPPTADLMRVMMKDSYKILEQRSSLHQTLVPYTEEQVNDLLDSLLLLPANGVLQIGNVKITSFRAGHILGAVMFLIEGGGQKLFVTGDLSFQAGRTIPGAHVPQDLEPDVVIMESTYGNRTHTDRNTEERRLANDVANIIANGGFALIPAFALGRAQEVLLVLQDYMDKGLIPEFPIYVDGLVTPISRIYKKYPHFLKGPVAYRIKNNGDAFLTDGRCKAVGSSKEREEVLRGKPGCIVASSGMLIGGASSWYAERLVSNEKNAIFITGYQDEESPGRKLLQVAEGVENQLELNGTSHEVKCHIGKYGLSAHADANEMKRFIEKLNPTHTLLVHGDDDARNQLGAQIDPMYHPILVENGETYPFEKRASGNGIKGKRVLQNRSNIELQDKVGCMLLYQKDNGQELKLALCTGVQMKSNILLCQTPKGKSLKLHLGQVIETIGGWNRAIDELADAVAQAFTFNRPFLEKINWAKLPNRSLTIQEIFQFLQISTIQEQLAVVIALQSLSNENRHTNNFGFGIYTVDEKVKNSLISLTLPIQGLQVNPAHAMEVVRTYLASNPRFIRCGVEDLGSPREKIIIYFDFPDVVRDQERQDIIHYVKENTGWDTDFSASVRQDLLQAKLAGLIGHSTGSPSIHLHERKVVITGGEPDDVKGLSSQFKEETGFSLQFKEGSKKAPAEDEQIYRSTIHTKRMENNQAIAEAKKWAADRDIIIFKTSIKQQNQEPLMEVHFISPEIAKKHLIDLEELSFRIGMPVTYAKHPKQNEIIRHTLEVLPPSWELKKNPSIHIEKATIAIKVTTLPPEVELSEIRTVIAKSTGYGLMVEC